ncbi:MAG: NAD(P)/FAD-dependent oxidoreductase [Candidatus Eiseniibacteriota bacterium]
MTVVGAGAAGLTAALRAAEAGARVTLLNAHPKVGLKILMSGGTRCNVTHREVSERDFNGGSRPFVARVLRAFPVDETLRWFASLGVALKLEETGKYFPVTDDAQTVLDALLHAVSRAGVELRGGGRAVRVARGDGDGFLVGVQTVRNAATFAVADVKGRRARVWPLPSAEPDAWLAADRVVLATGGLSFPRTGSDGVGYAIATALGHTLEPPVPALTPLAATDPWCREAQGVTVEAALTLRARGTKPVITRGSLLFAHFGYSGPAALDLSRHWHCAEGADERRVEASFAPGETREALRNTWLAAAREGPRRTVKHFLAGRVPERLAELMCRDAGVETGTRLGQVDRARRAALIAGMAARPLPVTGTLGYEKAEVTAGGVRLAEVDPSTLESRVAPGLYLCGEILDVEGRLGGFNFQWAWSSGTVAGRAATR